MSNLKTAMDIAYPIPDTPHTSVKMRNEDDRAAFRKGWEARGQQQDSGRDAALTDEQITESAHDAGMRLYRFKPTSVRTLRRFLAAIAAQQGKKD